MDFIWPAIVSFIITSASIFPTVSWAKKFNLLDRIRKVPRAGGLPVFLGITISILIFTPITPTTLGLIFGMFILLVVGLLDDKFPNLSPYLRLFFQFLASAIPVATGLGINFITSPFGGIVHFSSLISSLLAVIWIVWVMNMINWSKGVDGQMPGIVTVAAFILGLLSLKFYAGDPSFATVVKLCFLTTGAALGLLIFNWYPAKIFPGFSGSNILGFAIATLAILSGAKLATATLALLIPATDFAYTFIRRVISGKSPVWGDRGHLHHKLLEAGMTHQQISLFYILGSAILGVAALSLSSKGKMFAVLLIGIIILGGILWLNFFGGLSKHSDQDNG